MPIWLRRITFKFIQDSLDQEAKNKNNTEGNSNSENFNKIKKRYYILIPFNIYNIYPI